jgi:hypothetical protein
MLVNAADFPGPALWQGLMLLALPLAAWGMVFRGGEYLRWAIGGYVALGVILLVAILASA